MSFVEPVSRCLFPHEWSSCPGCGTQPLMPDTAMPWMKKGYAMKNTRITARIVSVEPAMTKSQRVRPMKACWNRAKPGATVYLGGSRDRYKQWPDAVVPVVDEGEYRHRGQGGFGQRHASGATNLHIVGIAAHSFGGEEHGETYDEGIPTLCSYRSKLRCTTNTNLVCLRHHWLIIGPWLQRQLDPVLVTKTTAVLRVTGDSHQTDDRVKCQ